MVYRYWYFNPTWEEFTPQLLIYDKTPVFATMTRNFGPLLVYLGGHPQYTSRDHAFFGAERFQKNIIAINDTLCDLEIVTDWRIKDCSGQTPEAGHKSNPISHNNPLRELLLYQTYVLLSRVTLIIWKEGRYEGGWH